METCNASNCGPAYGYLVIPPISTRHDNDSAPRTTACMTRSIVDDLALAQGRAELVDLIHAYTTAESAADAAWDNYGRTTLRPKAYTHSQRQAANAAWEQARDHRLDAKRAIQLALERMWHDERTREMLTEETAAANIRVVRYDTGEGGFINVAPDGGTNTTIELTFAES